jgi:hypothetical protein
MEIVYAAKLRLLQQIVINAESDAHQRHKTNATHEVQDCTGRILESCFGSMLQNVIRPSTWMATREKIGRCDVTASCPTQLKSVPSL